MCFFNSCKKVVDAMHKCGPVNDKERIEFLRELWNTLSHKIHGYEWSGYDVKILQDGLTPQQTAFIIALCTNMGLKATMDTSSVSSP